MDTPILFASTLKNLKYISGISLSLRPADSYYKDIIKLLSP